MLRSDSHLSDRELVLAADGELGRWRAGRVRLHLAACWTCRARQQEMEGAIAAFVHLHQRDFDPRLPPPGGPRALLKARIAAARQRPEPRGPSLLTSIAAGCLLLAVAGLAVHTSRLRASRPVFPVFAPNSKLTPGATVLVGRKEVCSTGIPMNRGVPVSLQRQVFEEYGIIGADPHGYEVDYLVTPALGGADDIHNLWPQSYTATIWNARVKDTLEERLHDLVCEGTVDLATAQHDISTDWISAYKKYFRTDKPL